VHAVETAVQLREAADMKRGAISTCAILLLSACKPPGHIPADAYQRWTDRMIVRFGLQNIGIWPCPDREETIEHTKVHIDPPVDECYKLQPPQRWRGTWVLGPGEHDGGFCPEGSAPCAHGSRPQYDLDWRGRDYKGRAQAQAQWGKSYRVDLIGRRTTYPLMGMVPDNRPYMIVVDRLLSIKEMGAAPKG
jgi:hypothetical protein